MADRFRNDVVMVTGASGLVGSACVAAFLAEGARVVAVGHRHRLEDGARYSHVSPDQLESDRVLYLQRNLKLDDEIESAFTAAEETFGPVSVLVNNAAVYGRQAFLDMDRESLLHVYSVNVFALLLTARRAAAAMIEHGIGGSIVNDTSTSSQQSDPLSVIYDSSKGAVDTATRGLAVVLGQHGIRVNAVGPGEMTKSQETDNLREPGDLSTFERLRIPIGRAATPQEVADAILFLSSADARGISGTILWVDGGTLGTWITPAKVSLDG
jgi:NAD(P)-dependent dehydrogenase (short-subunit alcohol dehydrogenase family)